MKTALHFAAAGGHIRCVRLLAADFVPSAPFGANILSIVSDRGGSISGGGPESSSSIKYGQSYICWFEFCSSITL